MADNAHAGMVAHQLAVDAAEDDEPRLVEASVQIHRDDTGLFCWIDEESVDEDLAQEINLDHIEAIERTLFDRFPNVLLDNAFENLTPEARRQDEDPPRVATVEYYPDVERIGGVAVSLDQSAQWAMIPQTDEGGDSA
ncbi:hypothetical protein [Halorubrum sp. LN27]|uniref:hypothetical protein n=1 Tax=Halorubrum sp. LN27 TaxID=2801032 RepID=UPI00190DF7D9|nr:hypothetical protein [Halorubrum sp. LN27]